MWIFLQYERPSKAAAGLFSCTLTRLLLIVTIHTAEWVEHVFGRMRSNKLPLED